MNRTIIKLFLVLWTTALLPFSAASQTSSTAVSPGASEGQFTLKTGTDVVLVNVTVRDKNGKFIKNLKTEDFSVLEDGKKQDIISIDAENSDSVVTTELRETPVLRNLTTPAQPAQPAQPAAPIQENDLKDRRLI